MAPDQMHLIDQAPPRIARKKRKYGFMRTKVVTLVAGLLLLASCANDSSGIDIGISDATISPMSKYEAALFAVGTPERQIQLDRIRNDEITACMKSEGFTYIPEQSTYSSITVDARVSAEQSQPEWTLLHGYGIAESIQRTALDSSTASNSGSADQTTAEYLDSFSDAKREAYDLALFGPPTDQSAVSSSPPQGCLAKADEKVNEIAGPDPIDSELYNQMLEMYDQAQQDPRIIEVNAKWSDCMADHGITNYSSPIDARQQFGTEATDLESSGSLDSPAWKELVNQEIETATPDLDCRIATNWLEVFNGVTFAWEQRFVDSHKVDLDKWVDLYVNTDLSKF